jgi:hypothetical protein
MHYLGVPRCKTCVLSLNTLFRGIEVVKHPFYSIWPKMMFASISEHFANLRQVKQCKTCVWGLNAVFWGTEVVKHPFYSIGPKLMFGTVSEHFANLRQATRCKTCVPSLNALFRGTNFWNTSIGPKMMFGSVSKYFTNLRQVKDAKLMFRDWMRCFGVPKLWGIHSTPLGPKWCLGVFRSISLTFDT